jgi:hypothetical protein
MGSQWKDGLCTPALRALLLPRSPLARSEGKRDDWRCFIGCVKLSSRLNSGKKNLIFERSYRPMEGWRVLYLGVRVPLVPKRTGIETEVVAHERSEKSAYASPSNHSFQSLASHSGGRSNNKIFRSSCGGSGRTYPAPIRNKMDRMARRRFF